MSAAPQPARPVPRPPREGALSLVPRRPPALFLPATARPDPGRTYRPTGFLGDGERLGLRALFSAERERDFEGERLELHERGWGPGLRDELFPSGPPCAPGDGEVLAGRARGGRSLALKEGYGDRGLSYGESGLRGGEGRNDGAESGPGDGERGSALGESGLRGEEGTLEGVRFGEGGVERGGDGSESRRRPCASRVVGEVARGRKGAGRGLGEEEVVPWGAGRVISAGEQVKEEGDPGRGWRRRLAPRVEGGG